MSLGMAGLIVIGGFILLLALGTEIAIALGVMSVIGFIFIIDQPLIQIAWTSFDKLNSFLFTAVPLFILMGAMFANTGVMRSLFDGAEKLLGGLPGGLACATFGAGGIFGAMSGSSIAAVATFGTIALPEMERKGYAPKLSLGSISVGGTLSVLIPPSIFLIIYGGWQQISVVRLFAAAMVPGIIATVLLIVTVVIMVKLDPSLAPKPPKFTIKEKLGAIKDLLPWLTIIVLVLGVIFGGIMTPTEAAALGASLSFVTALAYRKMSFAALKKSLWTAVRVQAMLGFIVCMASLMAFTFHAAGLTDAFASVFLDLPGGKWAAIVVIYAMYFFLGMFIDGLSMLVITLPFVMPVVYGFGFNDIWFGIAYVICAEIALVTPPFGLNLFSLKGVAPRYDITTIAMSSLYYVIPLVIVLVLITVLPQLTLWLPSLMF